MKNFEKWFHQSYGEDCSNLHKGLVRNGWNNCKQETLELIEDIFLEECDPDTNASYLAERLTNEINKL